MLASTIQLNLRCDNFMVLTQQLVGYSIPPSHTFGNVLAGQKLSRKLF